MFEAVQVDITMIRRTTIDRPCQARRDLVETRNPISNERHDHTEAVSIIVDSLSYKPGWVGPTFGNHRLGIPRMHAGPQRRRLEKGYGRYFGTVE